MSSYDQDIVHINHDIMIRNRVQLAPPLEEIM